MTLSILSFIFKLFGAIGSCVSNGFTSACDVLFPQLFGGVNKKKVGIVLQKSKIKLKVRFTKSLNLIDSMFSSFFKASLYLLLRRLFRQQYC